MKEAIKFKAVFNLVTHRERSLMDGLEVGLIDGSFVASLRLEGMNVVGL